MRKTLVVVVLASVFGTTVGAVASTPSTSGAPQLASRYSQALARGNAYSLGAEVARVLDSKSAEDALQHMTREIAIASRDRMPTVDSIVRANVAAWRDAVPASIQIDRFSRSDRAFMAQWRALLGTPEWLHLRAEMLNFWSDSRTRSQIVDAGGVAALISCCGILNVIGGLISDGVQAVGAAQVWVTKTAVNFLLVGGAVLSVGIASAGCAGAVGTIIANPIAAGFAAVACGATAVEAGLGKVIGTHLANILNDTETMINEEVGYLHDGANLLSGYVLLKEAEFTLCATYVEGAAFQPTNQYAQQLAEQVCENAAED